MEYTQTEVNEQLTELQGRRRFVVHDAEIHRRRALDLLHHVPVLGEEAVKPDIEDVIQPQGKVGVRRAIADGLIVIRVKLVEMPSRRHIGEGGQRLPTKLRRQLFKAAVGQLAEFVIALEAHLAGADGVIHGRLYHNAPVVGHLALEGDIVGDLQNGRGGQELL